VAFTPGRVELSARLPRVEGEDSLHPGDDVWLYRSAEGVHSYAPDDETSSALRSDKKQLPITK